MSQECVVCAGEPATITVAQRPEAAKRNGRKGPGKPASAKEVLRSFNTWAFKREQPTDCELMLRVIARAMADLAPVPFVLYWGKGPRSRLAQPEIDCLDYLATLRQRVRDVYAPGASINLVFTDTHAELNGHSPESMSEYFGTVERAAHQRGFETFRLSHVRSSIEAAAGTNVDGEDAPQEMLLKLCASASKWYRGSGTIADGAARYYRMNMAEKRAIELVFPSSIFVTFNGSDLRSLFPTGLPVFFMYSVRRGTSTKPWFMSDAEAAAGAA
jgi:hypothetical protein